MPQDLATVQDALRHVLVTLGDRFEHAVADAPPGFGDFDAGRETRRPVEIVRHLGGLMRFAGSLWSGTEAVPLAPGSWEAEVAAFRVELRALDTLLRDRPTPTGDTSAAKVLQGPLLDALTHVGQLLTLRRLAGAPVPPRPYFRVDMAELDAPEARDGDRPSGEER
jgi:hypothetical protein